MGEAPDDVDQLLSDIEAPGEERAMTGPAVTEEAPAPAAEQTWNGEEWGFDHNGRKIVPDSRDKIKTWMSQGYNYSQRMGELNKTHAQRMAEADAKYKPLEPYLEVDEYSKSNPEWWAHVQESYAKRSQPRNLDPALEPIIKPLMERVEKAESFIGEQQKAKAEADEVKRQENELKEDQALEGEIESIRKKYPNIDLASVDESGKPLELRVLDHAAKLGTNSFKAAYLDLLEDKLLDLAKANGREQIAKDKVTQARKGVLGQTQAPTKGLSQTSVRGKSYDQLTSEALAEMGIS